MNGPLGDGLNARGQRSSFCTLCLRWAGLHCGIVDGRVGTRVFPDVLGRGPAPVLDQAPAAGLGWMDSIFYAGHNRLVELRFTQAARKHRVGRERVRHVMASTTPTVIVTKRGDQGWLYLADDDRGVELEVIAVELADGALLVVHVMPTALRRK